MTGTQRPEAIHQTIVDEHREGRLVSKMFGEYAYRLDAEHRVTVSALVAAHNSGEIDLLALLDDGVPTNAGSDFFLGQTLYCELIPELEASADRIMRVVQTLVDAGGQDLAANEPNRAFREWCGKSASRVDEVIALADAGSAEAAAKAVFALEAGVALDRDRYLPRLFDRLQHSTGPLLAAAVVAAGRLVFGPHDEASARAAVALLGAHIDAGGETLLQLNLLYAASQIAAKVPAVTSEVMAFINPVDPTDEQHVHACADILWRHGSELRPDIIDRLLEIAAGLKPANKGTIDVLDLGLQKLWARGEIDRVIGFLEGLLTRHGGELRLKEHFDGLAYRMLNGNLQAVENLLVRWFLTGDFTLSVSIADVVDAPGEGRELTIDFTRFGLEDRAWSFLARKACGFFFVHPVTAVTFLASLLRFAPDESRAEIVEFLLDPMLVSYPGKARKVCERLAADATDPAAPYIAEALSRHSAYLEDIKAAGRIAELHPSERNRHTEWKRQSDAMSAAFKEAQKRSVFQSLFQRQVLLYGNTSVHYVRGADKESRRSEVELTSISSEAEFPVSEIVDPVGLQYAIMSFRSERLPA